MIRTAGGRTCSTRVTLVDRLIIASNSVRRQSPSQAESKGITIVARLQWLECHLVQVEDLLVQLAHDASQDVIDGVFEQLLPAVLSWTADTDALHTSLLPAVLTGINTLLDR